MVSSFNLIWYDSLIQVSLCVKRLVYTNDAGEVVKGVCSNFLCKDEYFFTFAFEDSKGEFVLFIHISIIDVLIN
jgi:sulfite reductase alpha subunit-like flavoprotein